MNISKKWFISASIVGSIVMLALLLCLVGTSTAQAMSRDGEIHQDEVPDFNPTSSPPIDYKIPTTCSGCDCGYCDGEPLVIVIFPAYAQSDREGRASGQTSLQLSGGTYQLAFEAVNEILRDAEQQPTGVVLRGRGSTSGSSFDFTYTIRQPRGQCCAVEILAPELHPSGGVRFEVPGTLRFE